MQTRILQRSGRGYELKGQRGMTLFSALLCAVAAIASVGRILYHWSDDDNGSYYVIAVVVGVIGFLAARNALRPTVFDTARRVVIFSTMRNRPVAFDDFLGFLVGRHTYGPFTLSSSLSIRFRMDGKEKSRLIGQYAFNLPRSTQALCEEIETVLGKRSEKEVMLWA